MFGIKPKWPLISLENSNLVFILQAQAVAEILRLEEWWGIEHTVLCLFMVVILPIVFKRQRGDLFNQLCQISCFLKFLATVGCFLWMASGLQGGIVFDGKLAFPSLALLSVGLQVCISQIKL